MTASTRRWSSALGGRPSFPKMLETCFSTAPSVTTSSRAIAAVRAALGHQREHVALARRELLEPRRAAAGDELGDDLGIHRRSRPRRRGAPRRRTRPGRRRGPSAGSRRRRGRRRAAPWRRPARRTARARAPGSPATRRRASSAARMPSSRNDGGRRTSTTHDVGPLALDRLEERLARPRPPRRPRSRCPRSRRVSPSRSSARSSAITTRMAAPRAGWSARRRGSTTKSVPSSASTRLRSPVSPPPLGVRRRRAPSSRTSTSSRVAARARRAPRARGACACLADVRERLGRRRSRRRSRRPPARGPPRSQVDRRRARRRAPASEVIASRRPRSESSAGRMPRARSRSSASARWVSSRASPTSVAAPSVSPAGELLLGAAELHRDGDQARLRAVVQVALDPLELQARGVDGAGARLLQVLDAPLELARGSGASSPQASAAEAADVPRTSSAGDRDQHDADAGEDPPRRSSCRRRQTPVSQPVRAAPTTRPGT